MTSVAELYALQELDLALQGRRAALADAQTRLGESEELTEAKELADERAKELREAEHNFREREAEADELRTKIEPVEKKLYQGNVQNPKELQDLQHDLDMLKRRRSELEDRALEAMEAVEQAQTAAEEARQALQQTAEAHGVSQEDLTGQSERTEQEIADLEARRAEQAPRIDAATMRLYEQIAAIRGRAVAKVEGGACQGCRISLPMNLLQRARAGNEMVQCSSCERILYVS